MRGFDFMTILRIMQRQWRIMLLFVILGIITGMVYIQNATRIYEAQAVLEMNVRRPRVIANDAVIEDMNAGRDNTDAIFNTRFEKFRSPAMEQLAKKEFFKRFPESKSVDNPKGISRYTLAPLIRDVEWKKDSDANIVRVTFSSPYPRFAANLVNVLSECAGQLMMEENRAQSDEAVKWLVSQVEEQREELETLEKQLADMRKDVQIDDLQQRRTALDQSIVAASKERESLGSQHTARKTAYEFIAGIQKQDPESALEMLPVGLPKGQQLNELIDEWRTAHDEFLLASGRFTALHPDYRLAKEKEERASKRLEQFIAFTVQEFESEIKLLGKQIEQVDERIASMKRESLDLELLYTAGMQKIQRLERARDAADTAYQTLLRRREEARRAADENMAFTKVIREASIPLFPVRPRKSMVMIVSLMLAGLIGLLAACITEMWRDTVESLSDLRSLNLNILGIIPSQKKVDSRGQLATIGLRDKFNPMVEIFAGINALLASGKYRDYSKVLLVCSVMPGEGKTVSTCNLAISAALNGARTLLIEGDLRRPQLGNVFAVDQEHPSLLEWVNSNDGSLGLDDLVTRDVVENLDIITSRPCKDINPAELLGRGHLGELLDWARTRYDRIIIDSPPLGPVSDAQVWGNHADALVMVARFGVTRRRALRYALARFDDSGIPLLGCIANDVPNTLAGMFSGAYGYGYNASYGYSNHHTG